MSRYDFEALKSIRVKIEDLALQKLVEASMILSGFMSQCTLPEEWNFLIMLIYKYYYFGEYELDADQ